MGLIGPHSLRRSFSHIRSFTLRNQDRTVSKSIKAKTVEEDAWHTVCAHSRVLYWVRETLE